MAAMGHRRCGSARCWARARGPTPAGHAYRRPPAQPCRKTCRAAQPVTTKCSEGGFGRCDTCGGAVGVRRAWAGGSREAVRQTGWFARPALRPGTTAYPAMRRRARRRTAPVAPVLRLALERRASKSTVTHGLSRYAGGEAVPNRQYRYRQYCRYRYCRFGTASPPAYRDKP